MFNGHKYSYNDLNNLPEYTTATVGAYNFIKHGNSVTVTRDSQYASAISAYTVVDEQTVPAGYIPSRNMMMCIVDSLGSPWIVSIKDTIKLNSWGLAKAANDNRYITFCVTYTI